MAERAGRLWTAAAFLATDQGVFGSAWPCEFIDGRIVAQAAPTPEHGAIISGLTAAPASRLRGNADGCRPEVGSGAAPKQQQRSTARIPDVTIRCGDLPRVVFEIVSPSELRAWRVRDRKRRDLQDVEGVREIVEIDQDEMAAHIYRREGHETWSFAAVGGMASVLALRSVGIEMPMIEVYEFALPGVSDEEARWSRLCRKKVTTAALKRRWKSVRSKPAALSQTGSRGAAAAHGARKSKCPAPGT